jgi:hypothetical protein
MLYLPLSKDFASRIYKIRCIKDPEFFADNQTRHWLLQRGAQGVFTKVKNVFGELEQQARLEEFRARQPQYNRIHFPPILLDFPDKLKPLLNAHSLDIPGSGVIGTFFAHSLNPQRVSIYSCYVAYEGNLDVIALNQSLPF